MFVTEEKTNWLRIVIIVFLATFASWIILFFREKLFQETLLDPNYFSILHPAPLPTEINQNFLTQVNDCFLPTAAVYGYTLRISQGLRTVAEQQALYEQGRTVNGHIVTNAPGGKSLHNYGYAVDIVDRWKEYQIDWDRLAKITVFCGLEPSEEGDISHIEYHDGLTVRDFKYGVRPVPLTLPCEIMKIRAERGGKLTLKDLRDCGAPNFNL